MKVGLWRKLSTKELMLLNCGVGEDLRVPWPARRSNQSILEEISPGCSLEGLMLKLNLQYFGHLMRRVDSLENTLMLGGIEGRRRRGQQRMRCWMASPTWWTWVWVNSGSWWWTERPGVLWCMGLQRVGHDWATVLNWTEALLFNHFIMNFLVHRDLQSSINTILGLFSFWVYAVRICCRKNFHVISMIWKNTCNLFCSSTILVSLKE